MPLVVTGLILIIVMLDINDEALSTAGVKHKLTMIHVTIPSTLTLGINDEALSTAGVKHELTMIHVATPSTHYLRCSSLAVAQVHRMSHNSSCSIEP